MFVLRNKFHGNYRDPQGYVRDPKLACIFQPGEEAILRDGDEWVLYTDAVKYFTSLAAADLDPQTNHHLR